MYNLVCCVFVHSRGYLRILVLTCEVVYHLQLAQLCSFSPLYTLIHIHLENDDFRNHGSSCQVVYTWQLTLLSSLFSFRVSSF